MRTSVLPFLLLFIECNSVSEHMENQVDGKVEESKQGMNAEILKLKQNFTVQYNVKAKALTDSFSKKRLQVLYRSISMAGNYLDSLRYEMDKLDELDIQSMELVKSAFLYHGAGDSIIHRMEDFVSVVEASTNNEQKKMSIKAWGDSLFNRSPENWKIQMFGLTNPFGASMILYELQTDLYRIGNEALREF